MFHRHSKPQPSSFDQMREARRQTERQLVLGLGPLHGSLTEYYTYVPLPDGHNAELKVIRPKSAVPGPSGFLPGTMQVDASAGYPFIVLFHGGGFSGGTVEYMTRPARDFALEFNAVVVSATYRLAPEHQFPTPMQDAWDTLIWLGQHATDFGADPSKGFIVGGVSAGGTMAAVLTQLGHDRGLNPPLTGSWLSIPLTLVKEIVPAKYKNDWRSMDENKDNPSLNRDTIRSIVRTLAPDIRSPLFSPFNSQTPHVGLPPTYVQVGGLDVLRDDGLVLEKALRENGVATRCDRFDELGHAAWTIYATAYSHGLLGPKTMDGMRWLLNGGTR